MGSGTRLSETDQAAAGAGGAAAAVAEPEIDQLESMEDLLGEPGAAMPTVMRGDVVEGLIVRVEPDEILVDVGLKAEGVVPDREIWDTRNEDPRPEFKSGETVLVYVVQPEGDGRAVLSVRRAAQEKVWRATEELYQNGTIIEATITEFNKGGVLVDVGPRGFVPLSQLTSLRRGPGDETEEQLAAKLSELVATKINVKIIELDRRRNRLILSARVAEREMRSQRRETLLEELEVGQIRKGIVSNICSFGAFIDLGGADGLAHISELSWSRVESPEEVLKPGEEIDVYVLSLDREEKKIALSLRRATKDPWQALEQRYTADQIVRGEVTKLAPFGAFVRLEDGIEGLAHASDLGDAALDAIHEGDTGEFRILSIDGGRRRIRLSPENELQSAVVEVEAEPEPEDDIELEDDAELEEDAELDEGAELEEDAETETETEAEEEAEVEEEPELSADGDVETDDESADAKDERAAESETPVTDESDEGATMAKDRSAES